MSLISQFAPHLLISISLLDASGNDGDRGALTATFAELLVREGNPHEYITLLDRLVDDSDRLLGCTSRWQTLTVRLITH